MRTTLITGARGGIGQALVRTCVAHGNRVVACDLVAPDHSDLVIAYELDVSSPEEIRGAQQSLASRGIELDALVHLAAIMPDKGQAAPELETFRRVLHTNAVGSALVIEGFLPLLTREASIVLATSGRGNLDDGRTDAPAYNLSKFLVNQIAAWYAVRLSPRRVCAVDPGWVQTDMGGSDAPRTPEEAANDIYRHLQKG